MPYEGMIYRPPSEARSFLLQVTCGCSHNKCTFCGMYKDDSFHLKPKEEIKQDLFDARRYYRYVKRIFLCDGDALCLANDKLIEILGWIENIFPECERVGVYARAKDILRKSDGELKELKRRGIKIAYIGAESGSPEVLKRINKGATAEELIESVKKIERAGISASVTFISGMGGKELWREHAVETGKMITEMNPSYASLLTLMLDRGVPLYKDIESGKFQVLSAEEVVAETALMMEYTDPEGPCVFRSNHASNYLSLKGTLPDDRDKMMKKIEKAMADTGMLKDERFRML